MERQNKMDRIVCVLRIAEETEKNIKSYHVGGLFFHLHLKGPYC